MQWAAGATITGKLNGKWSTDGSLTFRAIGQLKLPPALVSQLPAELQPLFKNGSLSYGYQWKVNTHGSADARNWTIASAETGTLDGQSYSFGSPAKSATDATAGTLSALGSSVFDLFKGGDFGGHVAGNVTVALGPRLRDAINSYMELAFGDYSSSSTRTPRSCRTRTGSSRKTPARSRVRRTSSRSRTWEIRSALSQGSCRRTSRSTRRAPRRPSRTS